MASLTLLFGTQLHDDNEQIFATHSNQYCRSNLLVNALSSLAMLGTSSQQDINVLNQSSFNRNRIEIVLPDVAVDDDSDETGETNASDDKLCGFWKCRSDNNDSVVSS